MCRMVGIVSTENGAAQAAPLPSWRHLVGAPHSLRAQAESGIVPEGMGPGHADSWGIGWFDDAERVSLVRQTGSAANSASFVLIAEGASRGGAGTGPARTLIGHLRKASCGAVTSENAHPVRVDYTVRGADPLRTYDTMLVAHNGTVRGDLLALLRRDLVAAEREEARSDSDTVVLAGWLAAQAGKHEGDLFEALTETLRDLFRRGQSVAPEGDLTKSYTAVNLLIAHPDGLFALRQFSVAADYYTLLARPLAREESEAEGWLVASEATDNASSWELLEPGVLMLFPARGGVSVRTATVAPRQPV
jgi:predicted glutamine amidotransferase